MLGYNKVMLMGHVTRDPELRQLPSSGETPTSVAEFGLACNRRYRTAGGEDREETLFIECTVFGKQADVIRQFVHKGKALFIDGRLRYETWEDNQGGKRSKIGLVVESFQFIGGREDAASPPAARSEGGSSARARGEPRGRRNTVQVTQADIPF